MIKWEYDILEVGSAVDDLMDLLDSLGSEGWELIHVSESKSMGTYFFKRHIIDPTPSPGE